MNDAVHFEKVRSLFENNDKGLLMLSEDYFKRINSAKIGSMSDLLARMQRSLLCRNYQAEMLIPHHLYQETKRCMTIR